MVTAVMIMGSLGVVVGLGLAVASKIFYVYVDPKILAVDDELPGANCGGCGLPGCTSNAEAIVAGKASPNSCVAAGPEVAEAIAAIMGVAIEAKEPDVAKPGCTYGLDDADLKYVYDGLSDCRAAALLSGGMKVCSIGCLGLGSCVQACQFDAIVMGPEDLPVVDPLKCTGCGACERVCPKHIINLSSVTRRIIREYTTADCTTPCQRACPAGIDICEYIRQIAIGDHRRAVQVIKERNPFPTVIGRICPRPCENECRRQLIDEPVAINYLKRYASDFERDSGERVQPYQAPATGRKIAVIGGGVEGLSTAFFLARLGHEATVFEAGDKLGGLLRNAIAANRLSMDILDWDIDGVLEMGVTAETGLALGTDFTIDSLLADHFEAVFLATGGWDSRLARGAANVVESPVPGVYLQIDLLRADRMDATAIQCGAHAVIAGGGESIPAAAAQCFKLGAQRVTVMLRESIDDQPLSEEQLDQLNELGVDLRYNARIVRLSGEKQQLTRLEVFDPGVGSHESVAADSLFLAAGRFPQFIYTPLTADADPADGSSQAAMQGWEAFEPYKDPAFFDQQGLLAAGDVLSDFSGAIRAIGAGRRAAASIHQTLYSIDLSLPQNVLTPRSVVQDVDAVADVAADVRQRMPLDMDPGSVELEKGFSESAARTEADRCLQCGLICYKHTATEQGQAVISTTEPAQGAVQN